MLERIFDCGVVGGTLWQLSITVYPTGQSRVLTVLKRKSVKRATNGYIMKALESVFRVVFKLTINCEGAINFQKGYTTVTHLLLRSAAINTELEPKVHKEGGDVWGIFVIEFNVVRETNCVCNFHEAFFRVFIAEFGEEFDISILDGGGEFVDISIECRDEVIHGDFVAAWINGEFRFNEGGITEWFKVFGKVRKGFEETAT